MIRFVGLLFLCLYAFSGQAQKARRVYYVGSETIVISDSAGTTPIPYHRSKISIEPYGNKVQITVAGSTPVQFNLAQVLTKAGTPYSTDSVAAFFVALVNSIPINTLSTIYAATYSEAVSKTNALPLGSSAMVKVTADESTGNAGTGPNGTNPTTYYWYVPGDGLKQQVLYPTSNN